MIKFKKMSTFAKIASTTGVIAVTGVAFIPVINKFVDNPKTKVPVYMFNGRYFKTEEAAELARTKFTAMSGLVDVMEGNAAITPNLDYKPLMAEFVSFVSKLFVVKVFRMQDDSNGANHFKYDGMSDDDKKKLLADEIKGQIHYGDLQDVTSLVKYATAHKKGNDWMFTPVDKMMLSILGDGSGQSYSQNELDYATISKTITKLKATYEDNYEKVIKNSADSFNGIAFSLVNGLTRHKDAELEAADKVKPAADFGDGSGDEYTQEFIAKFQQWGILKSAFEDAKNDLDGYVTANNIDDSMKQEFEDMVKYNAVVGWNNEDRYSTDELRLRDLLSKVIKEKQALNAKALPGGHVDTKIGIVEGWNYSASGDRTDRDYKAWQLQLAEDIQNREKLLSLNFAPAPDGALLGKNFKPTGDGSGRTYSQGVFDAQYDYQKTNTAITLLQGAIDRLITQGTIAAPDSGQLSDTGAHQDARGLADGKDYTKSWAAYQDLLKLQSSLKKATDARADFEKYLVSTQLETKPGSYESEATLLNAIDFTVALDGANYQQNFNQDQVDYAKATAVQKELFDKIAELEKNNIVPAPPGALADNAAGVGVQDNKYYAKEQIELRDLLSKLSITQGTLAAFKGQSIRRAPDKGAVLNPDNPNLHEEVRGTGDGKFYSPDVIAAAAKFNDYSNQLADLNKQLDAIKSDHPGFMEQGVSFQDLYDNFAVEGENNGEEYSQTEIDWSKANKELKDLRAAYATANTALTNMGKTIDDAKKQNFDDDYKNNKIPENGLNEKPAGDNTGNTYTDHDKAYYDALKTIKGKFPNGNPWWTTTTDKKSDEAYAALFLDWQNAINNGVVEKNAAAVGDGVSHDIKSDNFKVFNDFFKQMIGNIHGTDATKKTQTIDDLDTVINYLSAHGNLQMKNGWATLTETYKPGDTTETGDKSGHTYLKISDVWDLAWHAHYKPGNGKSEPYSLEGQLSVDTQMYDAIVAGAAKMSQYVNDASAAQGKIDLYDKTLADWTAKNIEASGKAESAYNFYSPNVATTQDAVNYAVRDGATIHGLSENELLKLAKYKDSDNQANGVLTDEQKAEIKELAGIDAKISQAGKDKINADNAVADIISNQHASYIIYTQFKDPSKVVAAVNYAGTGDGSGDTYDHDHIEGRIELDDIKADINKADSSLTGSALEKEIDKLLTMKSNSRAGLNSNDKNSPDFGGDTSNTVWQPWEIALFPKISALNIIIATIGSRNFAPEHAIEGPNQEKIGDGSGRDYSGQKYKDVIEKFKPQYEAALKAQVADDKALSDLKLRKAKLEGMHLSSIKDADPTKDFLTPDGHKYSMDQYSDSKKWLTLYERHQAAVTELARLKSVWDKAKQDAAKALSKHEAERAGYVKAKTNAENNQVAYAQGNINHWKDQVAKDQKKLDDADAEIKVWWTTNKDKLVDADPNPTPYLKGAKIAGSWSDFMDKTKSGSIYKIGLKLKDHQAIINGTKNIKAESKHTQEEIKLRDALMRMITLPSAVHAADISMYTNAFNVLIDMYKNDIYHKTWAKPAKYMDPTSYHATRPNGYRVFDSDRNGGRIKNIGTDHTDDFKLWIKTRLMPNTEIKNVEGKGSGKDETFDHDFFTGRWGRSNHNIKTGADVALSTLGKAAFNLYQYHDEVMEERKNTNHGVAYSGNSQVGYNSKGSGDQSGNDYSKADMEYYEAYKKIQVSQKEINDKAAALAKIKSPDGAAIIRVPDGYTATTGPASHTAPRGDGTGHTYSKMVIEDIDKYISIQKQKQDITKKFTDLQAAWEAKRGEANWVEWDAMIATPHIATVGRNHGTYWSKAEMDYRDADILGTADADRIAKLQKMQVANPDHSKTTPIAVTPAPERAVAGFNAKPLGLHDDTTWSAEQIAKRDELSDLNEFMAKAATIAKGLKDKGVKAAPDPDAIPVAMKDWHPVSTGDASGKTYDSKIWADKNTLADLKANEDAAKKALEDFKTKHGDAALKTILDEITNGMVDGINNDILYSTDEIALRDQYKIMGDLKDHLTVTTGASNLNFAMSQKLSSKSKLDENIAKYGIGDDVTYVQQELDLRNVEKKINDEEKLHGITDESAMAKTDVYLSNINEGKTPAEEDLIKVGRPVEREQQVSVLDFYNNLELTGPDKAVLGTNHHENGDESDNYYDATDVTTFDDMAALAAQIQKDEAEIAALKAKNVAPAPSPKDKGITTADAILAKDPTLVGTHKVKTGDESDNYYDQAKIDMAKKYVELRVKYDNAKLALDSFVNADSDLVKFFEFKLDLNPLWAPIAGRNWTDDQYELKKDIDQRDALKVGKTMVNIGDGTPSSFGTNRGHLGEDEKDSDNLVIYEGGDVDIKDEIVGSDKVRIGYVLNISGALKPDDKAPVLDSLKAVAMYLQAHKGLAPKGLIDRFALLQNMGTKDVADIYKISETTVSKDRFNTMVDNYKWGDK